MSLSHAAESVHLVSFVNFNMGVRYSHDAESVYFVTFVAVALPVMVSVTSLGWAPLLLIRTTAQANKGRLSQGYDK